MLLLSTASLPWKRCAVWQKRELLKLNAVLPENRTKAYKPYNPLPYAALGLYGFLYVYGIEMKDFKISS